MSSVGVVIPCYKYGHFLRECVESVLMQIGVDVRVLIIDDASPDNTPEVAAELVAQDPRVEYRRHAVNKGHIATYNEGLQWVKGDYTVLLSADDTLTPGSLLRATRLMDANPGVGIVYGPALVLYPNKPRPKPLVVGEECRWEIEAGLDWLEDVCRSVQAFIWSPEVVVRTSLQKELGGYRPELPTAGDQEMWMRFAAHGDVGMILDAPQAYYRIHTANMSAPKFAEPLKDLHQRKAAFDIFFGEYGHLVPDRERLQAIANRRLASIAFSAAGVLFEREGGADRRVTELIDFAITTYPDAPRTFGYAVLRSRMILGPRLSRMARSIRRVLFPRRIRGLWEDTYDSIGPIQ